MISAENSTLVTKVTLHTSHASQTFIDDVPTRVVPRDRFYDIEFTGRDRAVTVRLNGAERIALIELLGGTA